MGRYRCSQIPPVAVWSVVGISLLAFLYQSGLPPRALNRILFDIIASDELGAIGTGQHERVVVNRDDWSKRVQERLQPVQRIDIK